MASAVNICNEALLEVGARQTINDFDDGSPEALACQTFYEPMRRLLLRTAPWNFCRRQGDLSLLMSLQAGDPVPIPWRFEYLYPPDCVKLRYTIARPRPIVSTTITPTSGGGIGIDFAIGVSPIGVGSSNGGGGQGSVGAGIPQTGDILWPRSAGRKNRFLVAQDYDISNNSRKVILSDLCQAVGVWNRDEQNVDLFDDGFHEALVAMLCYKFVIPLTGNVGMKNGYLAIIKDRINEARAMDGEESLSTTDHTPDWIQARGYGLGFPYDVLSASQLGYLCEPWSNLNWGD